ncbi:hypothetical protein NMY22_g12694 [Coprinellus aureogranulatus]|nr:hypothetical protein NMY22_g12694 [Coprinellus aureogranulatus]
MFQITLFLWAQLAATVFAFPVVHDITARQAITTLSTGEISAYKPYTYYAGAAYCAPARTLAWNCGIQCSENSGFVPIASGGDGAIVQRWYVGWDASLQTIIVAYQGTDPMKLIPVLTDVNLVMTPLRPRLFPGVSLLALVHSGFSTAHALSANAVLSAVRAGISRYNATRVTLTGHSLGGALATIATAHLAVNLPSGIELRTITYGAPRVGNQRFADFVNSVSFMNRIVNQNDPVPVVPPRVIYVQTEGEIHIVNSGEWKNCPMQDSTDAECSIGYTPTVLSGDVDDHYGPYDGVLLGNGGCVG